MRRGLSARGVLACPHCAGQCLSKENLQELIKFAYTERIVLMADEVYQENVYQDERPFVSAKKVMFEMGEPYKSGVELLSFHTVSKVRGGAVGLADGGCGWPRELPGKWRCRPALWWAWLVLVCLRRARAASAACAAATWR